jgi:WD40 repeat protein
MVLAEHKERIWDLTFSGDGNWLATAAWDGTVHLHPLDSLHGKLDPPPTEDAQGAPVTGYLESMQSMQKYEVLNCFSNVWSVAFQPISHLRHTEPLLLTGAADHKIRVWRIEMDSVWRNVQVLEGHSNTVTSTAWHPDGLMFVSSSFDR